MELWKMMNPAAGRIKTLRRSPLEWLRVRMRYRNGEYPWFLQI